jgi:hypothetical protein
VAPALAITHLQAMSILRLPAAFLLLFAIAVAAPPAMALDLFARHEVTAQFATHDGKPMADAEVRVFAPGDPTTPVLTGHTDKNGKFVFPADRDGFWSAEARTKTEVARIMIRVGGPAQQQQGRLSPYLVLGVLGVLLVIAFWYRLLRVRRRQ